MPADLTPEKALKELLAMCERDERWQQSEKPWMGGPSVTVESVRAILARVTPSETGAGEVARDALERILGWCDPNNAPTWTAENRLAEIEDAARAAITALRDGETP